MVLGFSLLHHRLCDFMHAVVVHRREEDEEIWFLTQNHRRILGFSFDVVTFVVKSSTISMILFRNVSFPKKINNPFWVSPFFRRKVTNFIGRETKTHIFTNENQRKRNSPMSVPLTIIILD